MALLDSGNPDAALVLLERLMEEEGENAAVLEAVARANFDARRYLASSAAFRRLAENEPSNDYAHYGLGLSLWRLQRFPDSRDHLAMACVMRPDRTDYAQALQQVSATLRSREAVGLPLEGPIST
jgi:Flp pilus assembly protein TadD